MNLPCKINRKSNLPSSYKDTSISSTLKVPSAVSNTIVFPVYEKVIASTVALVSITAMSLITTLIAKLINFGKPLTNLMIRIPSV